MVISDIFGSSPGSSQQSFRSRFETTLPAYEYVSEDLGSNGAVADAIQVVDTGVNLRNARSVLVGQRTPRERIVSIAPKPISIPAGRGTT